MPLFTLRFEQFLEVTVRAPSRELVEKAALREVETGGPSESAGWYWASTEFSLADMAESNETEVDCGIGPDGTLVHIADAVE